MERTLVTGGAGFIGSHLVKALVMKGDDVIVIDNLLRGNKIEPEILSAIEFICGDVKDSELVSKASTGCSKIYHFAAVLGVDIVADNPIETMNTEVLGMQSVSRAAIINGVEKIIYASTSGIYGHSAITNSVSETVMVDPSTSYAISKRYNEIFLGALFEEKGVSSISLRYFNVYGPRQDTRMVIPRFFQQAMKGESITIFGNGTQTRDFTYIDDAISCTIAAADKVTGCEIFNVSTGEETTIVNLAKKIQALTNSDSEIVFLQVPRKRYDYEVERRIGHVEKLFNRTGIRPETRIDSGLFKVLAWYQQ